MWVRRTLTFKGAYGSPRMLAGVWERGFPASHFESDSDAAGLAMAESEARDQVGTMVKWFGFRRLPGIDTILRHFASCPTH